MLVGSLFSMWVSLWKRHLKLLQSNVKVPLFWVVSPTLGARGPLNCRDPQISQNISLSHETTTGALGFGH
jgi:hypothetical protein